MFPITCKNCGKTFLEPKLSHIKKRKYCSRKCANVVKTKWSGYWKDKKLSLSHRENLRKAKIGYIPWNKGKKQPQTTGEKNGKWIKDRTKLKKQQERNDSAYKDWRKQVWKRDNWKCKINNDDCKGRIEAHHILSFTSYPELRYEVKNGITLCHAHHPRKRAEEKQLISVFTDLVVIQK